MTSVPLMTFFAAKALSSIKIFEYVKIKLVKINNNPYLRIDVRVVSNLI